MGLASQCQGAIPLTYLMVKLWPKVEQSTIYALGRESHVDLNSQPRGLSYLVQPALRMV